MSRDEPTADRNPGEPEPLWTIPNILCLVRLVGCPLLLWLAWIGHGTAFLVAAIGLLATDWIDGKLAVWLKQQTVFGARLDSVADATLYSTLLLGIGWLQRAFLWTERWWLAVALISYAITSLAGLVKFGRVPSYHTRAAKTCWFLANLAVIAIFLGGSPWFFRIAAIGVTLTNLEATAITCILPAWQANVPSLWHARSLRH